MGSYQRRHWSAAFAGQSRSDRLGCDYDAYLPDRLAGWQPSLPGDVAADIADAEAAVRDLNTEAVTHPSLEGIARFLLRAESVASSRIEGLEAGARRLLETEVLLRQGGPAADRVAAEVLSNIVAMETAVGAAADLDHLQLPDLLNVHRQLLSASTHPELGGVIRTTQNWIGGSSYNPCAADYVPPPPDTVPDLLADLLDYVNGDAHSALVQAALAHAQFETIHPFADGNGRCGRALIHIVLRRRGLAPHFVPPLSLVLASSVGDYVGALTAFRYQGDADDASRSAGTARLLRTFAVATSRSCIEARRYSADIAELLKAWRARVGSVRAGSSAAALLEILPGLPVITVDSAASLISRSKVKTGQAVNRLVAAGILEQRDVGRQRYRVFSAPDVLRLFTSVDELLRSPGQQRGRDDADPVHSVPTG